MFADSKRRIITHARAGVLALAVGVVGAGSASAATIDTFNVPADPGFQLATMTSASDSQSGLPTSDVIGGTRAVAIDKTGGSGVLLVDINGANAGVAALNSTSGVMADFTFEYGTDGPLNADLSGDDHFVIHFVAADFGAMVDLTVTDGDSSSTASVAIPAGPSVSTIPFTAFTGIDFADVVGLKYVIHGGDSFDAQIDLLETAHLIPLPASAWAGAVLLGGLVVRRFRRLR